MELQRLQSGKKQEHEAIVLDESITTEFTGYETHQTTARIIGLLEHNQSVSSVQAGTQAYIITDKSPFFVECGGQISDQGAILQG